jgi:AraC family transcriptional regulator
MPPVLQSDPAWAEILVLERHPSLPEDAEGICRDGYVLVLHLEPGRLGIQARNRTRWNDVRPDTVTIVGDGASLEWVPGETGAFLAAAMRPMFLATVAGQGKPALGALRSGAGLSDPALAHVMSALGVELAENCPAGRAYWTVLATALATQLQRQHAVGPPEIPLLSGGLSPTKLQRVVDHIETHLKEELSVSDLARIAELSPSHFAAAFRKSTGMPPYRYAMNRRVLRAKTMLAGPVQPIADIAYALGYSSQAHFTTSFRRVTGMSPGAYRSSLAAPLPPVVAESPKDHRFL